MTSPAVIYSALQDFGFRGGQFGFKAQGCLEARVKVGIPLCKWCPSLAEVKVRICASANSLECNKGLLTELIFTALIDFQILVVGGSLTMKIFKHPGADSTWCPEKRANWVNGENHETTVHGKIRVCFIWCFDVYSGHLVPNYSNDAALRERRSNGYGDGCWSSCHGVTGRCDVCEKGAGSCCRSYFEDWTPECSGHGARRRHECGDSNYLCLERCGTKNPDGFYRRRVPDEACMRSNSDVC